MKIRVVLTSQYLDMEIENQEKLDAVVEAIKTKVPILRVDKNVIFTEHIQALLVIEPVAKDDVVIDVKDKKDLENGKETDKWTSWNIESCYW